MAKFTNKLGEIFTCKLLFYFGANPKGEELKNSHSTILNIFH